MNIAANSIHSHNASPVAIIGAGPYGLAAAAHLRAAGVPFRIFGDAMSFRPQNMPNGILLRSPWVATHIAEPRKRYTLDDFYREASTDAPKLLPVEKFVD